MSEKEKKLVEIIAAAIPTMSEFDKGYFLGKAESCAENNKETKEDTDAHE